MDYSPPINQLLTLGAPPEFGDAWPDYLKYGFGPEHIPELIRLATDPELRWVDTESREVWAPLHAWRTLGQLKATAATEPLLTLFSDDDDYDEWANEELPVVFGMIGPAAIPALGAYASDTSRGTYSRCYAANGLVEIAQAHPESRSECVALLIRQLEQAEKNDHELNGFFLSDLLDLEAVEAAPVMERAFASRLVDESIAGDWEYVQYELGLRDTPPEPKRYHQPAFVAFPDLHRGDVPRPDVKKKVKAKAKRKMAKKSRKQNRKRKK